jgi:hypothetical protein
MLIGRISDPHVRPDGVLLSRGLVENGDTGRLREEVFCRPERSEAQSRDLFTPTEADEQGAERNSRRIPCCGGEAEEMALSSALRCPPSPGCHDRPDCLHDTERPCALQESVSRSHGAGAGKGGDEPRAAALQGVENQHEADGHQAEDRESSMPEILGRRATAVIGAPSFAGRGRGATFNLQWAI